MIEPWLVTVLIVPIKELLISYNLNPGAYLKNEVPVPVTVALAVLADIVPTPLKYTESLLLLPPKNCIESAAGEVLARELSVVAFTAPPNKVLGTNPVEPKLENTFPVAVAVLKSTNAKSVGVELLIAKKMKLLFDPLAESLDVNVNPPVVILDIV